MTITHLSLCNTMGAVTLKISVSEDFPLLLVPFPLFFLYK